MSSIISVENLSKRYIIGHQRDASDGLRHRLEDALRHPFRRLRSLLQSPRSPLPARRSLLKEEFWALKDVSFEIKQGDVVGIVGRNGAGKSTLLKILSRITEPTKGRICIEGRVASLLEVGTGFHQELTGRENIFLNGAILGMSKSEIVRKFDEIVAFSEIEKFLDTPVKRYSSGMYVRLAFAVAAHLEPEILIVDEVLAVGDAAFQKKCIGKMGQVAKGGRTVLFVSHNMTAVKSLCSNGILLRSGSVAASGSIADVVSSYVGTDAKETTDREWPQSSVAPGDDAFRFKSIKLLRETDELNVNTPFQIVIELWSFRRAAINLSLELCLSSGEVVCAVASPVLELGPGDVARYICEVPGNFLNDETYALNAMIVNDGRPLYQLRDALIFQVHDVERTGSWMGKWPGLIRPQLEWTCESMGWRQHKQEVQPAQV